jgi:SpoVK/Ycf46/Vps4 family AAA+-type ATPase
MARGDLLVKLFRSYRNEDSASFLETANTIIDDERKKNHLPLATELSRTLNGAGMTKSFLPELKAPLTPLPKDSDRGVNLIDIRYPDRYFQDLVLSDMQIDPLQDLMEEFRQYEILEANGLRARMKMLFCGPPGCGKTVTAEAMANALGLPLLYVRFDAVVSSLLGETAANLRKVFDFASKGNWVLFFDEFDAIGRSRDDAVEHSELKRVVSTFLQLLDNFQSYSLVIAATNFEQSLDPALWRRFDEIIRFEKPDQAQVQRLLEKFFTGKLRSKDFSDFAESFVGLTHAEIERVCLDALRKFTLRGGKEMTKADINYALKNQARRKQALGHMQSAGNPKVDSE